MGATTRTVLRAISYVAPTSLVCLVLFFTVGWRFGTINDVLNGALAVLCGTFAVAWGRLAMLAVAGAAIAVAGSVLVISEATGYYLAGLVSALGFAAIGLWLLLSTELPARRTAVWAGAVMCLGFIGFPGFVQRIDDQATAAWWLQASGVAWAGTFLLLPWWAWRAARGFRDGKARSAWRSRWNS